RAMVAVAGAGREGGHRPNSQTRMANLAESPAKESLLHVYGARILPRRAHTRAAGSTLSSCVVGKDENWIFTDAPLGSPEVPHEAGAGEGLTTERDQKISYPPIQSQPAAKL